MSKPEFVTWLERRDQSYARSGGDAPRHLSVGDGRSGREPGARPRAGTGRRGLDLDRTLLAMLLVLLAVVTVLAVRAREPVLPTTHDLVVQQGGLTSLRAPAPRVVALPPPRTAELVSDRGEPGSCRRALPPMIVEAPFRVVEEQSSSRLGASPGQSAQGGFQPVASRACRRPPLRDRPSSAGTGRTGNRRGRARGRADLGRGSTAPTCANCGPEWSAARRFARDVGAPAQAEPSQLTEPNGHAAAPGRSSSGCCPESFPSSC